MSDDCLSLDLLFEGRLEATNLEDGIRLHFREDEAAKLARFLAKVAEEIEKQVLD